jgi:hypothetical protein
MLQETQKSKEKAITEIRCMVQEQDRLRREIQQYRYEGTDKKDGQRFYKVLKRCGSKSGSVGSICFWASGIRIH